MPYFLEWINAWVLIWDYCQKEGCLLEGGSLIEGGGGGAIINDFFFEWSVNLFWLIMNINSLSFVNIVFLYEAYRS